MLAFRHIVLSALCATTVLAADQDPASHFPTDVVLAYPGSKVAINQEFSLAYVTEYALEKNVNTPGLQGNITMGLILPDGTRPKPVQSNYVCGVGLGSNNMSNLLQFADPGVYVVHCCYSR
jgi:hypothetical protein